jgi:glycogen phosphorylase
MVREAKHVRVFFQKRPDQPAQSVILAIAVVVAPLRAALDLAWQPEFRRKVVFLENYDTSIARYMVQCCDVWLNTPLRPQEASGTSGMKAQANGVLNVSTLDGWWEEAWHIGSEKHAEVGWAIGKGEIYQDPSYQVQVEAEALYELLEREIVPAFYDRRSDGLPRKGIERMKNSITHLCPEFNMHRMVMQYAGGYYLVAHRRHELLQGGHAARAKGFAAWRRRVETAWPHLRIESLPTASSEVAIGGELIVSAKVFLDTLTPDDVVVQILEGRLDARGEIQDPAVTTTHPQDGATSGSVLFRTALHSSRSGLRGYAIRLLPNHPDAVTPFMPGLILWAAEAFANTPELALH